MLLIYMNKQVYKSTVVFSYDVKLNRKSVTEGAVSVHHE